MRCVLITGGSRGIGAAMVRLFSENGYSVAFTYNKSEELAKALADETGAVAIKADSSVEGDIVSAVKKASESIGNIQILINNAAVSSFSLFTDTTLEEWNHMFSVNVTGAFLYSRECLRNMIRQKEGRIINISSMWGVVGSSCEVHYSATKSAIIGMTKALAKEVGPSGINVNCIAPGVVDTDMNKNISAEDMRLLQEEIPLARIGTPEDVARCALYLAGDGGSYITGAVLNVNGGLVV